MRISFSVARRAGAAAATAALMIAAAAPQAPAAAQTLFQDVTAASGVEAFVPTANIDPSPFDFAAVFCGGDAEVCAFGQSGYIGGVLIADFNGDGNNDIFATNAGGGANALFINNGDGTFTDVADAMGVAFTDEQAGAAVAGDIDNDGDIDLYITNVGFAPELDLSRSIFSTLFGITDPAVFGVPRAAGLNRLLLNKGVVGGVWQGFEDATGAAMAGGEPYTRSSTPAMVDYDGDGDLDLFIAAHKNVFATITPSEFPLMGTDTPLAPFGGAISKRVSNPGCLATADHGGCIPQGGPLLLKNLLVETGTLKFVDATDLLRDAIDTSTNLPNVGRDGQPMIDTFVMFDGVWTDYDNDGDVDLVSANDLGVVGIYRNTGGGFEYVSTSDLISPNTVPLGSVFVGPVADPPDVGAVGAWMGISPGDVNGDGKIDFYATNAGGIPDFAFTQFHHALYVNVDGTTFVDAAAEVAKGGNGLSAASSLGNPVMEDGSGENPDVGHFAFGGQLFDMDNDGDLDLVNFGNLFGSGVGTRAGDITVAHPAPAGMEPNFRVTNRGTLYENLGTTTHMIVGGQAIEVPDMVHRTETMAERTTLVGIDNPRDSRGLAIGDLNNDGYVDLVVYNISGIAASNYATENQLIGTYNGGIRIFRNNGVGGNKALVLRLQGTKSNKSGFGARVTVNAGNGDIVREFRSNTGHRGNASLELVIGVGGANSVDVTIDWPSGAVQSLPGIALNGQRTCYRVVEHDLAKGASNRRSRGASLKACK